MNLKNQRILAMPEWAYDTILETLELDSQSGAFDASTRAAIRKALGAIREVSIAELPPVNQLSLNFPTIPQTTTTNTKTP